MVVPNSEHALMKMLLSAWPGELAAPETPWIQEYPLRIPPKFLQNGKIVSDRYVLLDSIRANQPITFVHILWPVFFIAATS